jgi:geranylgeranyl diphosphate synthase type II
VHQTPVALDRGSARAGRVSEATRASGLNAGERLRCPITRAMRDRLRAMAADLVSGWRAAAPAEVKTAAGLRAAAEMLVQRAQAGPEHVGWTMVTIVSEFWRDRLAAMAAGRRLLLLPDCPCARTVAARNDGDHAEGSEFAAVPLVCGPDCGIATIWGAARDVGWVVEPVGRAVSGIGGLMTGQYDGVLGIAKLPDLEKAFGMLPAFALPIAAVPFEPHVPPVAEATPDGSGCPVEADQGGPGRGGCGAAMAAAAVDVDWVLRLLGVAGGGAAPVGDYLPLLHEAAGMFTADRLAVLADRLAIGPVFGAASSPGPRVPPLDATASMAGEFLVRGGKFLRPFICLAAHDAVLADRAASTGDASAGAGGSAATGDREAVRAAAVAIEVFHKASLVHDDIEDGDDMRYGRQTLHVERGVPAAINAGDYLVGLGYRIVTALPGVPADTLRDVVAILADAHVRLARGQGAELAWRDGGDKGLLPDEALAIYGLKTSPAFEAALAMGIRLAGVEPPRAGAIGAYSLHVGTGFQVLNDLKDWNGDFENDRRAAGDLLGGRPTVMWALAMDGLSAPDAARLRDVARAAGQPGAAAADVSAAVAEVRRLYQLAGVFERASGIVAEQRSLAAAAAASCRGPRLREVLEFLLDLAVPEPSGT